MLFIVVVEWILIHSTLHITSYILTMRILSSFPSTVAIAEHCIYLSACVVSPLLDTIWRQYSSAVRILIDTKGGFILQSGSLNLIPKAVVHCGPGINQLNQPSTLWMLMSSQTYSHQTLVLSKETIGHWSCCTTSGQSVHSSKSKSMITLNYNLFEWDKF